MKKRIIFIFLLVIFTAKISHATSGRIVNGICYGYHIYTNASGYNDVNNSSFTTPSSSQVLPTFTSLGFTLGSWWSYNIIAYEWIPIGQPGGGQWIQHSSTGSYVMEQAKNNIESWAVSLGVPIGQTPAQYMPDPGEACGIPPACPENGTEAGALEVPGKYPPGPYCKEECYVVKDPSIEGFIEAYDPINNKTTILNTVYTGDECQLTDTSSDPEPPADCTEAQNRCVEFCGVNNVQTNTCTVGSNGEILVDCVCIDYPEPEEGQGSPAPAGDPTEPSDVPDPTDPAGDPAAADPETDPDLDTDKWLKAMKRAMEEGNDRMIARLNAIKDSIGVTNDAIHQGNLLAKNTADNTAATANNTSTMVGQLGDVKDGLARIENGVETGNQTLDEIADALVDETEGQPELAAIQPNNYDPTIPIEDMPIEEDLQGVLSDIYALNPFADALSTSGMDLNNSSSCITFPNPLGGEQKQICFDDYQSTWNAMGLVLLGLSGFMAFRIVKG